MTVPYFALSMNRRHSIFGAHDVSFKFDIFSVAECQIAFHLRKLDSLNEGFRKKKHESEGLQVDKYIIADFRRMRFLL
jgi:hypothetical protein